jgi:HAE1 family hydrophobic/amphiphilic exporter-1
MSLSVVSNDAVFILEIVDSLKEHLIEGTLLASLVVWIFLRSVRSTLIIALAIPVSLMGAIAVIYFAGFTLNSLTMLALLLLIGVVVDDAIVVLENIFRHREELDPDPVSAAINGSNEVVFAVIAATLSLVSHLCTGDLHLRDHRPVLPQLRGGRHLRRAGFAVRLAHADADALLRATCGSRSSTARSTTGPSTASSGGWTRLYRACWTRRSPTAVVVALATLAVVAQQRLLFHPHGQGLHPGTGRGTLPGVPAHAPGLEHRLHRQQTARGGSHPRPHPEIRSEFALIGLGTAGQVNQGRWWCAWSPREERSVKQQDVLPLLRKELSQVAGARVFAAPYPMVQGQRGEPLQFVLTGENLQELGRHAVALQRKLATIPGIGRMDTDLQLDLPQLAFQPDRAAHRRRRPEHPGRGPRHQHAHRRHGHRQVQ